MSIDLKYIQKCCLNIALDVDRVCRGNGISYSLCGGSVIGMHLYQGFIPWDDDIDLMMTRENYERFLEVYPAQKAERYHVRNYRTDGTENIPALFSRIEDMETEMTEEIAGAVRRGHVFVDLTVFDGLTSKLTYNILRTKAGMTYTYLYRKNGMTPGKWWKRAALSLLPMPSTAAGLQKKYEKLEQQLIRESRKGDPLYMAELLSAKFSGILYDAKIFQSYADCTFEGCSLMVVKDYMDYLHTRYGNREFVLDMPEEDRQKTHIQELS